MGDGLGEEGAIAEWWVESVDGMVGSAYPTCLPNSFGLSLPGIHLRICNAMSPHQQLVGWAELAKPNAQGRLVTNW